MTDNCQLLEVRDLSVALTSRRGRASVLAGVTLEARRGEIVGIVGESGSGKTTTGLAVIGLLPSAMSITSGSIRFDGLDLTSLDERAMRRLRGRHIAMIFQDPHSYLNPVFPIGEQLEEIVRTHKRDGNSDSTESDRTVAIRLLEQVNLPNAASHLRDYPHQLSGGMAQRVMIATAMAGRPDLLIADEPTSALDVTVQAQILGLIRRLARELGLAVLLISHNVAALAQVCDRMVVMYAGRVVEVGPIAELLSDPAHPYTRGLLSAVPRVGAVANSVRGIPGSIPSVFEIQPGCAFAARCTEPRPRCRDHVPILVDLGASRKVACCIHN